MINKFFGKKRKSASFDSFFYFNKINDSKENLINCIYLNSTKISSNSSYEKKLWNEKYNIAKKKLKEYKIEKSYISTIENFKKSNNTYENHNKTNSIIDENEYFSHCVGLQLFYKTK